MKKVLEAAFAGKGSGRMSTSITILFYSSIPMRVWMNNASIRISPGGEIPERGSSPFRLVWTTFIRSCQLLGTNPGPAPGRRGALSAVHGQRGALAELEG